MHRWCLLNLTVQGFSLNLTVRGVSNKHCLLTFFILFCLSIIKGTFNFMVAKSTFPDVCALSDERLHFSASRLGLHCL